jgi:steroid delta-isomerase-like uncharacterized protein
MSTDNKALIRRWLADFSQNNLAVIDELFDPNYTYFEPATPGGGTLDGFKHYMAALRQAYPDAQVTIQDQVAESDKVTTHFTVSGTHQGELMGIPASHRPVSFDVVAITQCDNGRFVKDWFMLDALGMLQQIGAVPAPA